MGSPPDIVRPPPKLRIVGAKSPSRREHLIDRDVGAVLEMPGVRIMAIRTAQQASRDEEDDPQARPVVAGRGLVGMAIAERALFVLDLVFIRGVGRNSDPEVITTSGFERLQASTSRPPARFGRGKCG